MIETINNKGKVENHSSSEISYLSLETVLGVFQNKQIFPFVESIHQTKKNGNFLTKVNIDLIVYTNLELQNFDSLAVNVGACENDMQKLFGDMRVNKRKSMKLLSYTADKWVEANMVHLNGQWSKELISADIVCQILALSGNWPLDESGSSFLESNFTKEAIEVFKSRYPILLDHRKMLYEWITEGYFALTKD